MGEQVCHLPAAEIQIGAPVEILLRIVIAPLERSQEMRPIEIGREGLQGFRRAPQVIAVAVPPGTRQRDLAQLARVEILALGLQVVLAGALLHAHLADALVDPRGLHDRRTLFYRARQRFFHVDVFAGVQRVDGGLRVPVVGRGDQRYVHFLHLQQRAMIFEILGVGRLLAGLVDLRAVNVADRHHVGLGLLEISHIVTAALAAADHAQLNAVVGSHHAGIGKRGQRGRCAQKIAAAQCYFRHKIHYTAAR